MGSELLKTLIVLFFSWGRLSGEIYIRFLETNLFEDVHNQLTNVVKHDGAPVQLSLISRSIWMLHLEIDGEVEAKPNLGIHGPHFVHFRQLL